MTNSGTRQPDLDRPVDLVSQRTHHSLELFRQRKAARMADRAAFEARREHGLKARHKAKIAHLAAMRVATPGKETPGTQRPDSTAA